MTDLSLYLANKLLRWTAGNAMPTAPASVFVALFDGDPKGAGTEKTTIIRAAGRLAVAFTALTSGLGNTLTSNADVDFGNAAGAVANLSHVGIFDASTSGNLLWSRALAGGPFAVVAGADVKFPSTDITFTAGS